jgi:hypothetical protein
LGAPSDERVGAMSTLFAVPCPECGGWLTTEVTGDLRCPGCVRAYHMSLGVLVPIGEPGTATPRSPTAGRHEPPHGQGRRRDRPADSLEAGLP